ncbi:MAG: homoserine dehydrogenase, partial [Actinobacteria bacterium]|nr:homoserine dehydrogenase [Actinomycetota bacterium]
MSASIRVGLLGCGVVGGSTARILLEHADNVAQKAGIGVDLVRIAVRSLSKQREVSLPADTYTTNPWEVVGDPDIDVIVEAMGGIEPALDLILHAIKSGKHIVTANKELLSTLGREVLTAADEARVDVLFEASVAGGIPIVRPMKESLAGDRVKRVMGIVNGTTNFILTQMSETGASFSEALGQAEQLGYTELDPSADIEGFDAAAKIAILASIAFGARVVA